MPDTPVLTSTRNPRVRAAASLSRRRERVARGQHLAEGPRAVAEALAAGQVVEVLLTPDRRGELEIPAGVEVTVVADHVLAAVADAASPQGIVAVVATPLAALGDAMTGDLVLVLDRVADPGNVGTIVRTADAAGASGVVVTVGSADPFGPKAARAAVGSTYHLPIATDVRLEDVRALAAATGRRLLGLDAGAPNSVFDLDPAGGPVALVLGSEAHGLAEAEVLDGTLAIPIAGKAESLNVGAAAAVAAFAVARTLRDGATR
ncbi:TrmH family RNA methyltransferase [Nitriliruptor alkaliphilus]|uniref:TrmH family RNA methyltransferase n=1 Tax=Nitriliruptor alkaliphilus TaxID=427918 RepID=UPI000695E7B3|nr:RNA methyltransferase [Nitriliruptor alkaliphilus]